MERDTILVDPVNPHQAADFASVMYGDNIILAGGSCRINMIGEKVYLDKVHMFNITTGYWYELSEMPHPKETKGVLVKDKLYLVGGHRHRIFNDIETYDLVTGEWEKEAELLYEVARPDNTEHENIIYFFEMGKLQSYDTKTKEVKAWIVDIELNSSEMFFADGKLFIVGGFDGTEPFRDLYSISLFELSRTRLYGMQSGVLPGI
ncbi:MAG: hypothetical protein LUD15_11330 [Bacteroides sp.]|nr:hypothetical protein [Bacteroides sp.]